MTARSRVFISYRRAETDGAARLIYNYLTEKLGKSAVFMDIKGIAPGDVFRKTIAHELETCNTMIVVISKSWTGKTEAEGRSRLHEEGDFVRRADAERATFTDRRSLWTAELRRNPSPIPKLKPPILYTN